MLNKIKYYIIGPRRNWEIDQSTFIVVSALLATIFFVLLFVPISQYFLHEATSASLQKTYETQKSTTEKLETNLEQLQQKILALQKKLDEKNTSLANLKTIQKSDTQAQLATKEKVFNYQLEANNLLTGIKKKDSQIKKLEAQQKKYSQQIQSLSAHISNLEKLFKEKPTQKTTDIASLLPKNNQTSLLIDQFQIRSDKNIIAVNFKLRNTGDKTQSGYVSIAPILKEQLNKKLGFNNSDTLSFLIRRFRPFSQEFEKSPNLSFVAIRVTVWDRNKKNLLNQNFLIE